MKNAAAYDRMASSYDWLSRLVFGRAQVRAQTDWLGNLVARPRLLIVGGGTGWILEALAKTGAAITIVYVEQSAKMMDRSMQRESGNNSVQFVQMAIQDYCSTQPFDVVFTPFLFDHFSQQEAGQVFARLDSLLKPGGSWVYADFKTAGADDPAWQRVLVGGMYLFFRLLKIVDVKGMPDVGYFFRKYKYATCKWKSYYSGLIESAILTKPEKADSSL